MLKIAVSNIFLFTTLVITCLFSNNTTSFIIKRRILQSQTPETGTTHPVGKLYRPCFMEFFFRGKLPIPRHNVMSGIQLQGTDKSIGPPADNFVVRLLIPAPATSGNKTADVMHGLVQKSEAEELARTMKLDLVVLNDKISPPLYKIVDKAKFEYDKEKKRRELSKKNVNIELKEVKISYQITEHDKTVRVNTAKKFLAAGHRVRLTMHCILNVINV